MDEQGEAEVSLAKVLRTEVVQDAITAECANAFDYAFDGATEFVIPALDIPAGFALGLIVGPSGSGKTSLLSQVGQPQQIEWAQDKAICSAFASATEAKERFGAVGLNSVPVWMKPYHVLSCGEQFRADLAARLEDGAVIDEFTSVVDRAVAKSCAHSVQRYIRAKGLRGVVFASCHYDIIDWLQPDWIFDTASGALSARGSERRQEIRLEVLPVSPQLWPRFRDHHYLSGDINRSARCWVAEWEGVPVGFAAILAFPRAGLVNGWRGHRTVILPEFQGLGLGVRLSDAVGAIVTADGGRYFSKTASARMGEYRNKSPLWKPTTRNGQARPDYKAGRSTKEGKHKMRHAARVCYSHEFIGGCND